MKHGYKADMADGQTSSTGLSPVVAAGASDLKWSAREREVLGLWSDLLHVTSAVRGSVAELLATELDLHPEEVDLLMRLDEAPERRLRMADASRSLNLSKSGVTRLVDRLVERGLVERAACPSDRRVVYAGLTGAGRHVVADAAPLLVTALGARLGRDLSADELGAVRRGLSTLLAAPAARPQGTTETMP